VNTPADAPELIGYSKDAGTCRVRLDGSPPCGQPTKYDLIVHVRSKDRMRVIVMSACPMCTAEIRKDKGMFIEQITTRK
jgi:hypothetical protein